MSVPNGEFIRKNMNLMRAMLFSATENTVTNVDEQKVLKDHIRNITSNIWDNLTLRFCADEEEPAR